LRNGGGSRVMKPKILFVDDEQNILDSLRLSLRGQRVDWDMTFALGGAQALEELGKHPHDVVVSDMRMPGMDGAQLLRRIQKGWPQMARIVLSGYSDKEGVLENVCLAHQYLGKPCRTADLTLAIRKALELHGVLANEKLKTVIARIDSLPALPDVYLEFVEALHDEDVSAKRVGDILSRDVSLSASVLRVVNCPFFGFSSRVSSLQHAATLLGIKTLRTLLLSSHLFTVLDGLEPVAFSVRMLWDHSIRVAGFARRIAEFEGLPETVRDDCAIAGLIHDIGKLVLGTKLPMEFAGVLETVHRDNCPLHEAEMAALGTTHAEVGAYLFGLWGFNHEQMGAVRWHQMMPFEASPVLSTQMIVHIANVLDHELVCIHEGYAGRNFDFPQDVQLVIEPLLESWRSVCVESLPDGAVAGHCIP